MSYYNNVTLTNDGKFKNNGRRLKFGLQEVETIYNHKDYSRKQLSELTQLSTRTVDRIKKAINEGYFDEYLSVNPNTTPVNEKSEENDKSIVNIHDIHITINNNTYDMDDDSVESKIKLHPLRLKEWSKKIRERGKYICAKCGKIDTNHCQAHHIFPKAGYPNIAYDKGNGIVLCQSCHADYHKKYSVDDVNPYTFIYWMIE